MLWVRSSGGSRVMTRCGSTTSGAPVWEDAKAGGDATAMGSRAIFAQVSGLMWDDTFVQTRHRASCASSQHDVSIPRVTVPREQAEAWCFHGLALGVTWCYCCHTLLGEVATRFCPGSLGGDIDALTILKECQSHVYESSWGRRWCRIIRYSLFDIRVVPCLAFGAFFKLASFEYIGHVSSFFEQPPYFLTRDVLGSSCLF